MSCSLHFKNKISKRNWAKRKNKKKKCQRNAENVFKIIQGKKKEVLKKLKKEMRESAKKENFEEAAKN